MRVVPSQIQTFKVNVALYQRFEKVWYVVKFCDISKCHNVTPLNFVTFLGFCHTLYIFFSFFARPLFCFSIPWFPRQHHFDVHSFFLHGNSEYCHGWVVTHEGSVIIMAPRATIRITLVRSSGRTSVVLQSLSPISLFNLELRKLPHHIGSLDRQAPRVAYVVLMWKMFINNRKS